MPEGSGENTQRADNPLLSACCPKTSWRSTICTLIVVLSFRLYFAGSSAILGHCPQNGRVLLANLFQGSKRTLSCAGFPIFLAFKEGMWDTQISALLNSPTVTHEPGLSTAYENREAIFRRVGWPTVTHEPGLSTAYENREAIFRRVSLLARFVHDPLLTILPEP
jgi:hypothetical protein